MIDPLWCAEFCGFFWGEGNFMIDLYERSIPSKRKLADGSIRVYEPCKTFTVRVRMRITQRSDNRQVLEHILKQLGGHIYVHKGRHMVSGGNGKSYINNQQLVWQLQDCEAVAKALDILEQSQFPTMKRREIAVIRQVIQIVRDRKYSYSPEARRRLHELKIELSNLRVYSD